MKKVGFIGFGNMAEAIITGMISSGNFKGDEIGAFDTDADKLNSGAEKLGITAFESNEELVSQCECVFLAVKPIALQNVLIPLRKSLCKVNPLVISIAAGQSIKRLKDYVEFDAKVIRVMPNINAIAGQAVSGYAFSDNVTESEISVGIKILESFGTAVMVNEEKFSVYSAIAGCSPAYSYLFIDAVARVGVKYGLSKRESLEIVASAVADSVNKLNMSDKSKFDKIVFNAIEAAYKKDKGM